MDQHYTSTHKYIFLCVWTIHTLNTMHNLKFRVSKHLAKKGACACIFFSHQKIRKCVCDHCGSLTISVTFSLSVRAPDKSSSPVHVTSACMSLTHWHAVQQPSTEKSTEKRTNQRRKKQNRKKNSGVWGLKKPIQSIDEILWFILRGKCKHILLLFLNSIFSFCPPSFLHPPPPIPKHCQYHLDRIV